MFWCGYAASAGVVLCLVVLLRIGEHSLTKTSPNILGTSIHTVTVKSRGRTQTETPHQVTMDLNHSELNSNIPGT
jgi:hypothetical protein